MAVIDDIIEATWKSNKSTELDRAIINAAIKFINYSSQGIIIVHKSTLHEVLNAFIELGNLVGLRRESLELRREESIDISSKSISLLLRTASQRVDAATCYEEFGGQDLVNITNLHKISHGEEVRISAIAYKRDMHKTSHLFE